MKKKIAIVDDEVSILDMLERYLKRRDVLEIDTFSSPSQALPAILSGKYDLVLSDIMMPEMNGVDLLKKVKEARPNQNMIMMTAFSTEEKMITCDVIGACDYVTKPFLSMRDVENKILDRLGL